MNSQTIRCTSCGNENPGDARFCIECSASLVQAAEGSTTRLPGKLCSHCGSRNPDEALFCVICGRGFAQQRPAPAARPAPAPSARPTPASRPTPTHSQRQHSYPHVAPTPRPIAKPIQTPAQGGTWASFVPVIFIVGIAFLLMRGAFWPGILWLIGITCFVGSLGHEHPNKALSHLVWWGGLAFLFTTKLFFPGILVLFLICMMLSGGHGKRGWW